MKKAVKKKLTLNKETVASLEAGKLIEVAGGGGTFYQVGGVSDRWQETTCL